MNALRRLLALWRLYATLDILFVTRSFSTAMAWYVSDFVVGLATITATFLLAERFGGIGGWSLPQVVFMLGYGLIVRGGLNTLFNYNLAHISRRIGRGQLDHVLIQPQPLWMALVTEGFAPVTGAGMLAPGVALLVWSMRELGMAASPAWLAVLLTQLIASMAIVMAFNYAWATIAFWAPRSAEEINSSTWNLLVQLQGFPLDGLPTVALTALLTVVPVGLLAWLPTRALLGIDSPSWGLAVVPMAALLMVGLAVAIFLRGLAHYGQTGSSRYLSWGHRG